MPTYSDGKIVLDRIKLKQLRRQRGLSQEQLAFQCAERSLCVSVASIKRAETAKNILYRTARDIARFYDIDLDNIVSTGAQISGETEGAPSGAIPPKANYHHRKHLIVVRAIFLGLASEQDYQQVLSETKSEIAKIAAEHNALALNTGAGKAIWFFGAEGVTGMEAVQATFFALALKSAVFEKFHRHIALLVLGKEIEGSLKPEKIMEDKNSLLLASSHALDNCIYESMVLCETKLISQLEKYFSIGADTEIDSVKLWQIESNIAGRTMPSELVGRKIELCQFDAVLDSSIHFPSAHVVSLIGVAGIGKSRLLQEFCGKAKSEGLLTFTISILDFGDQSQHQLIPQLVKQLLEIPQSATPNEATCQQFQKSIQQKLESLRSLDFDRREFTPLVFTMLGWPINGEQGQIVSAMSHEVIQHRQLQIVAGLLHRLAVERNLLLAIEDLHWANNSTLEFLKGLFQHLENDAVIFLLSYRPDSMPDFSHFYHISPIAFTSINLAPLDDAKLQQLARQFSQHDQHFVQNCINKSQGNPLFLEYLLRDVSPDQGEQLPFSLQSLIMAKLRGLDEQQQLAAMYAAVIGQQFDSGDLAKLLDVEVFHPKKLIDQHLVTPISGEHRFCHALIHDGIYQSIMENDRKVMHSNCAKIFTDSNLELAIKHFHRAENPEVACHIFKAIQQAFDTFQYESALSLVELGFDIDYCEIEHFSLARAKGEALTKLGRFEQAAETAAKAVELTDDCESKILALLIAANSLNTLDRFEDAVQQLELGEKLAKECQLPHLLSEIYHLKGNFYFPKGNASTCFDLQNKALSFAMQSQSRELEAKALGGLGDAAYAKGDMLDAYKHLSRCLNICEEHKLLHIKAPNLFMLATVRIYQNQYQQAEQDALEAIELTKRVGNKRAEIVSRLTAAWIFLDHQQWGDASSQISTGLELADKVGAKRFRPFFEESLARLEYYSGDKNSARNTIAKAVERLDSLGAFSFIGPWLLGTQALICNDERLATASLEQGQICLDKGSIGHNHFRYHVAAMEYGLTRERIDIVDKNIEALARFTENSPSPWSNFYIQRAKAIKKHIADDAPDHSEMEALVNEAQRAGLKSAIPLLKNYMQ